MQPQDINNEDNSNLVARVLSWLRRRRKLWVLSVGVAIVALIVIFSGFLLLATREDSNELAADESNKNQSKVVADPEEQKLSDSSKKTDSKKSKDDKKTKDKTDDADKSTTTQKSSESMQKTTAGGSNPGGTGRGDSGGGNTGGGGTTTPTPSPPAFSGFPTPQSTGPRYVATQTSGSVDTSYDGQVINRRTINGSLLIRHNNVTVRDTTVNATGSRYMVQAVDTASGNCPTNLKFEYVEINGAGGDPDDAALYASNCGYTFDHGYIHNVGRGIISSGNITVTNSYVHTPRTYSGSHRNAILSNGGSNMSFINNTLYCENSGCSSAVSMYGDFRPIDNVLLQNNLLATTGSYCFYGASGSDDPYEDSNLRIIGNHFSSRYRAECGIYGAIANFDNNVRGNQCYGNVWHESGSSADSEC